MKTKKGICSAVRSSNKIVVVAVLVVIASIFVSGCIKENGSLLDIDATKKSGAIQAMKMMPAVNKTLGWGFGYIDVKTFREDEDISRIFGSNVAPSLVGAYGFGELISELQVDLNTINYIAMSRGHRGTYSICSGIDAKSMKNQLASEYGIKTLEYRGVDCLKEGNEMYIFMKNDLIHITGSQEYMDDCIDTIKGKKESLYNDEYFTIEELSDGFFISIRGGGPRSYHDWPPFEGMVVFGLAVSKANKDEANVNYLYKFDDESTAHNYIESRVKTHIKTDYEGSKVFPIEGNKTLKDAIVRQEGKYVIITGRTTMEERLISYLL